MKSNFKKMPGSRIELEVALDEKEFQEYWRPVYEKAINDVEIKGFRPGTAPKEMAAQAINQDKVFSEAANKAIRFGLDELSAKNNWTFIDAPQIEILDGGLGLKYKTILTIFPEIKLGNYKKIAKRMAADKKEVKIESGEVDKSLDWIRNSRAKDIRVARAAKGGDLIDADIESFVNKEPIKNAHLKNDKFIVGNSRFMPGFDKNLENRQEGENLDFTLTAPDDYWNKDLRGKNVEFKVRVNGVFERQLPDLNDEFVKGLGKFSTVEELRKSVSEGLLAEKQRKEQDRIRLKILEEIIKESEIDLPEIMVEKTLDGMVKDFEPMLKSAGKNDAELRGQLREKAGHNVASNLIIYKIAETENLKPAPEELEKIDNSRNPSYNYGIAQNEKVFQFLESQK